MSENRSQSQETTDHRARVELLDANGQPIQIVDVTPAGLSIGRLPGSGLVLDASTVSRNHLRVDWDGQAASVTDLGSRAGTQLGAIRLTPQIAQIWNPSTLIQIGPYTLRLRIEAASASTNATNANDDFFENPAPLLFASAATAVLDSAPTGQFAPLNESGQTGRLSDLPAQIEAALVPGSDILTVVPGIAAHVDVLLTNHGTIPEIILLNVEGVPPEWAYQSEPVLLAPGAQATSTVQVTIPADSTSRAGSYPAIIRVHAVERGEDLTSLVSNWTVLPFSGGDLQANPKRITDRKQGIYTLALTNQGNNPTRYALTASDSAMALSYLFGQTQVVVDSGETVEVPLTVEAPNRVLGNERTYSIAIQAVSSEGDHQSDTVAFAHRALLPFWIIPLALLLLIGLGLLGSRLFATPASTAVANGVDLRTIVAQTAVAAEANRSEQETQIAGVLNQTSTAIAGLPLAQRAEAETAQALAAQQTQTVLSQQRNAADAQAQQAALLAQQTQQAVIAQQAQQTQVAAQATAAAAGLPTPPPLPTATSVPPTVVAGVPTNTVRPTPVMLPTSTANTAQLTSTATGTPTQTPSNTPTGTLSPTATPRTALITFGAAPSPNFLTNPFTVGATTNSDGAITYSVAGGPCTIVSASAGTFAPSGAGACIVQANTAATSSFTAGSAQQTITITKASQTINFTVPGTKTFGDPPFTVTATGGGSLLPVTFTAGPGTVCTIAGATITIVGAGTCTVNANQAGNANFNAAGQVSQPITVNKANQTITNFTVPGTKTFGDPTFTVSATGGGSLLPVTFTAGPNTVCTIAGATITIVGGGTCTVNADQAGNANYNAAGQVSQPITVNKANQTITNFTVPGTKTFGDPTFTVSATGGGSLLPVTFTAGPNTVCTIAGATITIVGGGTCTVNADQAGNANYNAAGQVSQPITVNQANQTITNVNGPGTKTLPSTPFTMTATGGGSTQPVTFSVTPASAGICTSGGTNGATITFVGAGTCTVNVNQAGDANYNAAPQVQDTIAVSRGNQTITNFNAPPNVTYGAAAFAVSASATSGLAVTFTVTPASAGICTVAGTTVTIVGAGTCTVNAAQNGDANYNAATNNNLQQSFTIAKAAVTVTATSINLPVGTTPIPPLAFTTSALQYADTPATAFTGALATTAPVPTVAAGSPFPITQGTLAAANYTITFVAGTITVP